MSADNSLIGTIDLVVFSTGGCRVAVEAHQVTTAVPVGSDCLVEGQYVEVAALLGQTSVDNASRQCLAIRQPHGSRMVLVEGPVELLSLECDDIHPLPSLLAARTTLRGLRALAQPFSQDSSKTILLFDANALLG